MREAVQTVRGLVNATINSDRLNTGVNYYDLRQCADTFDDELTALRTQVETLTRERDHNHALYVQCSAEYDRDTDELEAQIAAEREKIETLTRERDEARKGAAILLDSKDALERCWKTEHQKVRRLVECVRKIENARDLCQLGDSYTVDRLNVALTTVSDITQADEVQS